MAHITFEDLKVSFREQNNVNLLREAIDAGFDIHMRDHTLNTLLIWASFYSNIGAIQMLLEHNANPNVFDNFGGSPLLYASAENMEAVTALINAGANIHHKTLSGTTPLIHASKHGKINIVQFLLDRGCDPFHSTPNGTTASNVARNSNYPDIADFIDTYNDDLVKPAFDI